MIAKYLKLVFFLFLVRRSVLTITILNQTSSIETQAIFIPHKIQSALSIRSGANKLLNSFGIINREKAEKSPQKAPISDTNVETDLSIKVVHSKELADVKYSYLNDQSKIELKERKQQITSTSLYTKNETSNFEEASPEIALENETTNLFTSGRTNFKIFELGGFCEGKRDGLYDDDDCENFIICYAGRTFRTKCALGTMWNHWTKECDFPEKVDCDRKPSTISTPITSINSTISKLSSYSFVSRRTLHTRPTIIVEDMGADLNSNIRTNANVVLISILIPIAIIVLAVLVISLWIWNRTFKKQKRQLESTRKVNNSGYRSNQSSRASNDSISNRISRRIQKRCSCLCNPIVWSKRHNSFKPYMMHICSKSGSCMKSIKSNSERVSRMTCYDDFRKATSSNSIPLTPIENCCQLASNSHGTLSSHFEENNWDYNFATRGLYLTQPWIRGEYNKTFVADSYTGSLVLTLDPCQDKCDSPVASTNNNDAINNNGVFSDVDGYYA